MQFSTTILYSIILTLAGNALAAPINGTATEEAPAPEESGVVGLQMVLNSHFPMMPSWKLFH